MIAGGIGRAVYEDMIYARYDAARNDYYHARPDLQSKVQTQTCMTIPRLWVRFEKITDVTLFLEYLNHGVCLKNATTDCSRLSTYA